MYLGSEVDMWTKIIKKFSNFPAQEKVVRLLLERGFQINSEEKVVSGTIEIPHTQIAKEVGADRRVVDATVKAILGDETLKKVFQNITSIAFLEHVAPLLGLGVIIIIPKNAQKTGILGEVATTIAKHNISIRQAVTDDPYFTENPKLTIITETKVPGEVVDALMRLPSVKSVTVY
ncbi:MAG: amino acid-binding protein [Methanocellales archaeon]|nr:amino acid-binding protein [Methanocellales archaeon]